MDLIKSQLAYIATFNPNTYSFLRHQETYFSRFFSKPNYLKETGFESSFPVIRN